MTIFWEIVHNLIAHPLLIFSMIGTLAEDFHDFTARKMGTHA